MKKLHLITLLAFVSFAASAQTIDSVYMIANWKLNDTHQFKVEKTKYVETDGNATTNDRSSYIANMKIIAIDTVAATYTINFTADLPIDLNIKKFMSDKSKYPKTTKLDVNYEVGLDGSYNGIVNGEIFIKEIWNLFDEIKKNETSDTKTEKEISQALSPFVLAYASTSGLELMLQELQLIHYAMGANFYLNDTIFYDEELPNQLGGDPLRTTVSLVMDSMNSQQNSMHLQQQTDVNSDDVKDMIKTIFKMMEIKDVSKKDLKNSRYEIQDTKSYYYDTNLMLPTKIRAKRKVNYVIKDSKGFNNNEINIDLLK